VGSPPHFVMLLKWQSSVKVFSQIWQYSKYESRIILSKLSCCRQFWENLAYIYIYIGDLKKGMCDKILFFQNILLKMAKTHHKIIH
jgi:hypothetical protein